MDHIWGAVQRVPKVTRTKIFGAMVNNLRTVIVNDPVCINKYTFAHNIYWSI